MRIRAISITFIVVLLCAPTRSQTTTHSANDSAPVSAATTAAAPPVARVAEVTDDYFGTKIADPYRWMESGDAELTQFLNGQGAYTEHLLSTIPGREKLAARVRELSLGSGWMGVSAMAGPYTFCTKQDPGEQLYKLVVIGADGKERVLVDPAQLGQKTGHASISNFSPSFDGKLIGVHLGEGGGEVGALHIYDTATGKELPDRIERIWGEFRASWLPDSKGFFYTQMPPQKPGVDAMLGWRVFLHILGRPASEDSLILGPGTDQPFPVAPTDFPSIRVQPGTEWMIASTGGAHPEARYAVARLSELRGERTPWRKVTEYSDGVGQVGIFGKELVMLSHHEAPNRRLLRVPLEKPDLGQAQVLLPEDPESPLQRFAITKDAIYVVNLVSGRARVRKLGQDGGIPATVKLPYEGSASYLVTSPLRSDWYLGLVSWTHPLRIFHGAGKGLEDTGMGENSSADFSAIAATEVEVTADDGEKVPLTILAKKGLARDGSHPAIIDGYGGYGISILPQFDAELLAWLERGGVYAYAHVRGGGEKGEHWHVAGQGKNKPRGIKDFQACAEYLAKNGWTSATRLTATGGSMGGVLIGRAMTERPELFAAAVISVGELNALRYLEGNNGANQTAELQGTPATPEGFRTLLAMDAYQNIKPGIQYPAVMVTTGANDKRVPPWTSAKFAARLQATSPNGKPALLRVERDAGHGFGSTKDQEISLIADTWSFMLWQAGDPEFQPKKQE